MTHLGGLGIKVQSADCPGKGEATLRRWRLPPRKRRSWCLLQHGRAHGREGATALETTSTAARAPPTRTVRNSTSAASFSDFSSWERCTDMNQTSAHLVWLCGTSGKRAMFLIIRMFRNSLIPKRFMNLKLNFKSTIKPFFQLLGELLRSYRSVGLHSFN